MHGVVSHGKQEQPETRSGRAEIARKSACGVAFVKARRSVKRAIAEVADPYPTPVATGFTHFARGGEGVTQ
jgi:hypothetical protein